VSIVIPVYDRSDELRRALESVREQSFEDFECIVVDDASSIPIKPIVSALGDERFLYTRNDENGGPYNARVRGYRMMRGDFVVGLDSDWAFFPWTLDRAVSHIRELSDVDGVAGLCVSMDDGRLLVRIDMGRKIVTPAEYAHQRRIPDCLGVVRRVVVEEWLDKRDDYFALEFHQWFTFHMHHSMLYVDEPWARLYAGGQDRVSLRVGDRRLDDYVKFLEEHRDYVQGATSVALDHFLEDAWFQLARAGRQADAARFAEWLEARGLSRRRVVARRIAQKAGALVPRRDSRAFTLE
jgi:glycosyltransferase involved in cell wall biosynthesis